MAALIRDTPRILRGTELETPSVARWTRSTHALLVAGVVVIADPIIFALAATADVEDMLLRRPSVLALAPMFTAMWALFVVRRAQRSDSSGRMIGWAVVGAALNAGCIAGVLASAEGAPIFGALVAGLIAIFVATPASVPVGLAVGSLLWVMHHWERSLRSAPTQDARVRWISVAALWVGVVGVVGELLCTWCTGYAWRSDVVAVVVLGPHLALFGCAVLALIGAWRTARLGQFLDRVQAGRVRGLTLHAADESADVLTAGVPDGQLVYAEGEGAFRTTMLGLGTISRRSTRLRTGALVALAVLALAVLMFVLATAADPIPMHRTPLEFW